MKTGDGRGFGGLPTAFGVVTVGQNIENRVVSMVESLAHHAAFFDDKVNKVMCVSP